VKPQLTVSNSITRQGMRRKLIELAFQDISKTYAQPRKARRKMARAIGKKAFKAWRVGDGPVNV